MESPFVVLADDANQPLGDRITAALRRSVLGGRLRAGDPVPSTRALAAQLGVARSTVVAAYDQLVGEGYLDARQGARTRVAVRTADPAPAAAPPAVREVPASAAAIDLLPGHPSTVRIDGRAWRAAFRRAAATDIPTTVPAPLGEADLRTAIVDHIRHARAVLREPADIVVTAGTSDAAALLSTALVELRGPGVRVAVETPGYASLHRILARRGVERVPVPVHGNGFDVAALAGAGRVDAVMVTPSHQYPLGGRLPVSDRLALIDWADRNNGYVFEDDYDSEFRHTGAPLPAMASLDDRRVVLIGSTSKILSPALRLGYLVLPADAALREAITAIRTDETCPVPTLTQAAIAQLLANGTVRRGIAAARRDYAHRRGLVLAQLGELSGTHLSALDGGLHAVLRFEDRARETAVVAELAARGVAVAPLSSYSLDPTRGPAGIVFGYAAPGDLDLATGLRRVAEAVAACAYPSSGSCLRGER